MKKFMDQDFILENETAKTLYHQFAKEMPICDFHCHLSPQEIAQDKQYKNITELWLGADHYKWRVLRGNGIHEAYITGDKTDYEKFMKWAETLPYAIGNPAYHWTHLELQRYFGIEKTLSPNTADEIWKSCNEMLQNGALSARRFIEKSNTKIICTTDDPIHNLEYHKAIKNDPTFDVKVLPTFRPDKAMNIELSWFVDWITELGKVVGYAIKDLTDLKRALIERIDFFGAHGCFISDHALDTVNYAPSTLDQVALLFQKGLRQEPFTEKELKQYKGAILVFLGREYAKRGWTMQLHIGALRNNSTRMLRSIGSDTGFDSIHDEPIAAELSRLLDALDDTDQLPKTILYCLNPRDNEVLGTMIGNFQGGGFPGKIQFGSGWWFNDQKDGMERQIEALSQLGLLSRFIGMVTDSRSFSSYIRHEYFRRILCNKIGKWVENGEYPNDLELLGKIVQDICYNNAMNYLTKGLEE